jgi:hypothetical protein
LSVAHRNPVLELAPRWSSLSRPPQPALGPTRTPYSTLIRVSRKWRKAKKDTRTATPSVPYGPPVAKTVKPHRSGKNGLKAVAVVGATIAAPYVIRGIFKLLSKT